MSARPYTPEQRFTQHKAGGKLSAGKPHKFGLRLRLDLMKGIGPFSTRKEAEAAEKGGGGIESITLPRRT